MENNALPTLKHLAHILSGSPVYGPPSGDLRPASVAIDSRACTDGALFFALPGSVADGHEFVASARRAGAVAAVVRSSTAPGGSPWSLPVVVVEDALIALQRLAGWYVTTHLSDGTIRIGVTGSNGKTTTKEMLASILRHFGTCFASSGNLNSETGLPLSVLATPPRVPFAVYEMAMSNPGEMAPLAHIVRPHHAVITNIGTAHIGLLGSREAIAREKKQITAAFNGDQTLYVPEDDDFRAFLSQAVTGTVRLTGPETQNAQLEATTDDGGVAIRIGDERVVLPLPGIHNGRNALIAAAVAGELGFDAVEALRAVAALRLPDGRAQTVEQDGVRIINDAYNANPDSMGAALTMAEHMGATVLILGDMLELGAYEEEGHRRIVAAARASDARVVCFVGPCFARAVETAEHDDGRRNDESRRIITVPDAAAVGPAVAHLLRDGDTVFLKGSHGLALETTIPHLRKGTASHA